MFNLILLVKDIRKKNFDKCFVLELIRIFGYIASIIFLGLYSYRVIIKYYSDPDIGLSVKYKHAEEIPLPAVTICSPRVLRSNLTKLKEYYEKYFSIREILQLTNEEQNFLAIQGKICGAGFHEWLAHGTKNRTEKDFVKLLDIGAPQINETFAGCGVSFTEKPCESMVRRVLTDLGMCYTFNMQSYETIFNEDVISSNFDSYKGEKVDEHWTLEKGYSSPVYDKIPYRGIDGQLFQFYMFLNTSDTKDLCNALQRSYKIIFHLPNEIPTIFHVADFIQFYTESIIRLTAVHRTSDPYLKKYSPETRQCFFEGERQLAFFKSYTKAHCNLECLSNFTLRRCGCVKFSFPHDKNTRICDLLELGCILKADKDWPNEDENSINKTMPCNCYPPCTDIHYSIKQKQNVELSAYSSIIVALLETREKYNDGIFTALMVDFFDFQIKEDENFVSYTLDTLIADCGGLLGLFLGFSFVGLIDFFHKFFTSVKSPKSKKKKQKAPEKFMSRHKSARSFQKLKRSKAIVYVKPRRNFGDSLYDY